jgi:hypothetical protein
MASMEGPKIDFTATHLELVDAKQLAGKHVEGSALLVNKEGGVRRLPVPSKSPNDPLNWSVRLPSSQDHDSAVRYC